MANNENTEDERGRQIKPVLYNTAKDGSGTWYFPLVDSEGRQVLSEPSGSGVYTTPAHTNPTIANTTTLALASNSSALYRLLANESGETIWIKNGADAVLDRGIPIKNGGNYEMSKKLGNLYTGVINGICASGGKVLLVTEGV